MALTKIPASLLDTANHLELDDNKQVRFGTDNDGTIHHDGSHFRLRSGTGNFNVQANDFHITDASNSAARFVVDHDGETRLYHNGSVKLTTLSSGASVTGSLTVSGDLNITGDINSTSVNDLDVVDKTITLGVGQTEGNSGGSGIVIDGSSASILWDESNKEFDINRTLHVQSPSTVARVAEFSRSGSGHYDLTVSDVGAGTGQLWFNANTNDYGFNFRPKNSSGNHLNALFIDPDGKIGINDTNPDRKVSIIGDSTSGGQYPLSLDATNTDYTLEFRRNGTSEWWIKQAGSSFNIHENGVGDHLRIFASGNISVGSHSASYPLDVQRTSGHSYIRTMSTASNTRAALLTTGEDSSGNQVSGYFGSVGDANEVEVASLTNHKIKFYVNNTPAKGMALSTDGYLGIGTNSPADKLHVYDGDVGIENSSGRRYRLIAETDGGFTIRDQNASAGRFNIDTGGYNNIAQGMRVGFTSGNQGSSAERFTVYNASSGHSRFVNAHDSYSTVYIKNTSTTANTNQPFLTFQDTSGNRGNFGLRYSTAQLVIQGHGGVGIKGGSGFSSDPSLFINSSGRVGIGTSSPNRTLNLHVSANDSNFTQFTNSTTGEVGTNGFLVGIGSAGNAELWNYEAQPIIFATSSTERARIDSSGNFGIGTNNPSGAKLHVAGGIKGTDLIAHDSTGINLQTDEGTKRLVVSDAGYIGIGTTSPGVELDIKRTTNSYPLRIGSTQGEGRAIVYADVHSSPTKYNWIAGVQYNVNNGYEITPSTAVGGYTFSNPAIAILSNGNVGIGSTGPQTELHVRGSNASAGDVYTQVGAGNIPSITIQNASTGDNNNAAVFFRDDQDMRASLHARFVNHSTNETELRLSTTDSSGNTREKVTIDGSGTVEIHPQTHSSTDMASLKVNNQSNHNAGTLTVYGGSSTGMNGGILHWNGTGREYRNIVSTHTAAASSRYWHIKTNILATNYVMFIGRVHGYSYGNSGHIVDIQRSGYAHTSAGTLSGVQVINNGSSSDTLTLYYSSDNYVCFKHATPSSGYYSGYSFDIKMQSPTGYNFNFKIIAHNINSTSGNYY